MSWQCGDPTNTSKGGESIYGQVYGEQAKYFQDEIFPTVKHTSKGLLAMANHLGTLRKANKT